MWEMCERLRPRRKNKEIFSGSSGTNVGCGPEETDPGDSDMSEC
jgi:hypothetical protein